MTPNMGLGKFKAVALAVVAILAVLAIGVGVVASMDRTAAEHATAFVLQFKGVITLAALASGTAVFGMVNQLYTGTPSSRRQIACPSTVVAGDPLFVGNDPCVALDSYQSAIGGCTALFDGSFNLFVISRSANSPLVNTVIKPGDRLYASAGTRDATTNVYYGFTLDANSSGILYGELDPSQSAMTSGAGATVGVKIDG